MRARRFNLLGEEGRERCSLALPPKYLFILYG